MAEITSEKQAAPLLKVGRTDAPQTIQQQTPVEQKQVETNDFVFNADLGSEQHKQVEKNNNDKPQESKFDFSRFKQYVGKDEFGEDDLENAFKERETKLKERETEANEYKQRLSIVKEGKERLKNDKQFQDWQNFKKETDENLVTASLAYEYAEDGLSASEAMKKAKDRVKAETERNPNYLEDSARGIRRGLNQSIAERENQIYQEIENAAKDVSFISPSVEFEQKVKEYQPKVDEFLGMKLDEKDRNKLVSKAYKTPQQLNELLKDPATYNKVCLLLEYEKQFKANIENRTNGKSKVFDKLPKTPSVGSGLRTVTPNNGSSPKKFDGAGFLGR